MGIYITTFICSYIFCVMGELFIDCEDTRKLSTLFFSISVLIVSIINGARDNSVGVDTYAYTVYYFNLIPKYQSLAHFLSRYSSVYEIGFNVFAYFIGRIFRSENWFLFWCAVVIYGFSLNTFIHYRDRCSVSMAWLFFLMLNCTEAFNITRQYMAMAIAGYAFCCAIDGRKGAFIIWSIIATSFHVTAILIFGIYPIYLGMFRNNNFRFRIFVIVGAVILASLIMTIGKSITNVAFIGDKLETYISDEKYGFQLNPFLIRLPFMVIILLYREKFCGQNDEMDGFRDVLSEFLILMVIVELIISQLRGFNVVFYRLVLYLMPFKYVAYSRALTISPIRGNRIVLHIFAYLYIWVVFYYWVGVLNSARILPYSSSLLGIG